ncbi:DUF2971 domain-containing protein [Alteromonas macleodii]
MKLYKFKSITSEDSFRQVLQYLERNSIWCASVDTLNDSEEFNFAIDYQNTKNTEALLTRLIRKSGRYGLPHQVARLALESGNLESTLECEIDGLIKKCREQFGVTSFSSLGYGEKLWKSYGGEGNGVILEYDVSDSQMGDIFHFVDYKAEKKVSLDTIIRALTGDEEDCIFDFFKNVLCTKTTKWSYESEVRYLAKSSNILIRLSNPVKAIVIGDMVSEENKEKLSQLCLDKGIGIRLKT